MSKVKIGERVERRELQAACKYQNFPRDLNIHDPKNQYAWDDEPVSAWVWVGRALFCLGLFVGSYVLTLLTFLF